MGAPGPVSAAPIPKRARLISAISHRHVPEGDEGEQAQIIASYRRSLVGVAHALPRDLRGRLLESSEGFGKRRDELTQTGVCLPRFKVGRDGVEEATEKTSVVQTQLAADQVQTLDAPSWLPPRSDRYGSLGRTAPHPVSRM